MKSFSEILKNSNKLSKQESESLLNRIVEKVIPKGTIIQRQGDLNTNAYYVKKGLLRSFSIDEKGKEHTFMFAPETWVIADGSYMNEKADLFIETLEDTTVEILNKNILQNEYLEATSNNEIKQSQSLMRRTSVLQKRVIMLMSATALERYNHFVATYPQFLQRVPQKMIASYLGITPEALSKVKNQRK